MEQVFTGQVPILWLNSVEALKKTQSSDPNMGKFTRWSRPFRIHPPTHSKVNQSKIF